MVDSPIQNFYKGRTVFVTGASGLMGKVLVEKLLYSCPDIDKVYMLVRPKRGKNASQRLDAIWQLPAYKRLREKRPEALAKMVAVEGDVTLDELGVAPLQMRRVQQETSVVFHFAATLRLEAELKDSVTMNLIGTRNALAFCRKMPNLVAFMHLSTAFCYTDQKVLFEKVVDSPHNVHDVMRCMEWMDADTVNNMTPSLIAPHPNTYTYTKRLAESLVKEHFPEMPVCIARPSIVTPAYQEPCDGWVDNLNGPVGILVGCGKGVIRSMYCFPELYAEVIPLDFATNGLVAIGWKTGTQPKPKDIPVYNVTNMNDDQRMNWGQILETGRELGRKYPFEGAVWYPNGNIRTNKLVHQICVLLFHIMPAYFIDFLMLIFRQKRFMVRIQKRISDGLDLLQEFTTRQWIFDTEQFGKLWREMTPYDRNAYSVMDPTGDVPDYMRKCILGAKQFCMKEKLENLPKARLQHKFLYVLDIATKLALVYWFVGMLLSWTGISDTISSYYSALETAH